MVERLAILKTIGPVKEAGSIFSSPYSAYLPRVHFVHATSINPFMASFPEAENALEAIAS